MDHPTPLRQHFDERLAEIRQDVVRMGTDANEMVRRAVEATLNGDTELAERVIAEDDRVDMFERQVVNKAVMAVMQEAPVARDLRMLISALGVVGEIEKVGDHAVKLARRSTKLSGHFPPELKRNLQELGELARRSVSGALRLFMEYDDALAEEVIKSDHAVDNAYAAARNHVFDLIRQDPSETDQMVRTIEAFHALEHVADHAVAMAVRLRMLHGG